MKYISLLLLISWLPFKVSATSLSDQLCKPNEEVVSSFIVEKDKKTVSICKEKTGKYLVYRFGTSANIETEFPESLDESSWKKFVVYVDERPGIEGSENAYYELTFSASKYSYSISENRTGPLVEASLQITDFTKDNANEYQATTFSGNATIVNGSLVQLLEEKFTHNRPIISIKRKDPEQVVAYQIYKPALVKTKKWKAITHYEATNLKGKEKWEKRHYYEFSADGKLTKDEETEDEDNFTRGSWRQEFETMHFDEKGRLVEKKHFENQGESDSIYLYSDLYGYNPKGQLITESYKDAAGEVTLTKTIRYDSRGNDIEYTDHYNKSRWTRTYDNFSRQLTNKEFRSLTELVKIDSTVYTKAGNQLITEYYQTELSKGRVVNTGYSKFISDNRGNFMGGQSYSDINGKRTRSSESKLIYNNLGLLEQKQSVTHQDIKTETRTLYYYNARHDLIKEITYSGNQPVSGKRWVYVYY